MFSWILALLLAVVAWSAATVYLWWVRRRRDETRAGLAALASLHWREFSEIIRRALQDERSWQVVAQADEEGAPRSDFLMRGEQGATWMISCKHGRAYRIGAAAVNELGTALRLAGAQGGVLITEGIVEREGLAAAERQHVEILDGRRIWPVLKPYLAAETENRIVQAARRRAQRHTGIAALASLTLGLLVGLGYLSSHPPTRTAPAIAAAPVAPATLPSATTPDAPASSSSEAALAVVPVEPDPATLDRYQASVSRALAQTPGITRGIWLTRLTLAVDRQVDDATAWPLICREVERYPVLRTVRIQLNPRPGVDEPVRWRQCRTI
ncbi:restriction endonuclease [Stenotrophomonas sp. HITSZ_GD]|uniref:restriction endonuclease n=1 Tax=Stenotrophomonas sp. HITSZ_GD TaxID=3037248 RepID=UPI00240E9656|nr:restriction endonuclease [Stenotrophomonas sp. HITSZ_GD]MDG2526619.1 restriction endonuclease [Stenotrophomonas sp. HITSZ_GD]